MSYSEQVKSAYYKMCENPMVSLNLKKPTPSKLRKECLVVYRKKNSIKDQQILKNFLEITEEVNDLAVTIKSFDLEKFRPPVNFLIGKTTEPRDETIEFVAWLIDFKFSLGNQEVSINKEKENQDIESDDDKNPFITSVLTNESRADEVKVDETNPQKNETDVNANPEIIKDPINPKITLWKKLMNSKTKKAVFSSMLAITATCTGFYIYPIIIDPKCMYWTGDHYEAIACDEKKNGVEILAFDEIKARDFKRITQPDTISLNSVGKIFYSKIDNQVEFFTSKGKHPVYNDRILKPVTQYIIETYAHKN